MTRALCFYSRTVCGKRHCVHGCFALSTSRRNSIKIVETISERPHNHTTFAFALCVCMFVYIMLCRFIFKTRRARMPSRKIGKAHAHKHIHTHVSNTQRRPPNAADVFICIFITNDMHSRFEARTAHIAAQSRHGASHRARASFRLHAPLIDTPM